MMYVSIKLRILKYFKLHQLADVLNVISVCSYSVFFGNFLQNTSYGNDFRYFPNNFKHLFIIFLY